MSATIKGDSLQVVSGGAEDPKIVAGTADPTTGFSGSEGSIYLRYAAGAGQMYVKTGATNNDWGQISPGGGGSMSIGGTVTGGTARNLLFVGSGPVLAQSNNLSYTTDGVLRFVDVGTPVAPSPDGGLTCSNSYMKICQNGGAFYQIATYDGLGPPNGYVAFGQGSSVDGNHIGPSGALNYRPLFWNDADGKLGVGTPTPGKTLSVIGWDHDATVVSIQTTAQDSYAGTEYSDSSGNGVANIGYGNSSVGLTFVRNKFYLLTVNKDIVFCSAMGVEHAFGMTPGQIFQQMNAGDSAPVSDSGTARLRYNSGTSAIEVSYNGSSYAPLAGAGVGFQGAWAAGAYQAGSIVTSSGLTFGTAAATSNAPIPTVTTPALTDTSAWQYNGSATPLVGPPATGQLVSTTGQNGSIVRKATFNFETYLEIDFTLSTSGGTVADAYYVGILDAAYPDTTSNIEVSPGFWGAQFQLYGTQYIVPTVAGAIGGVAINHSTQSIVPFAYKLIFNTFAGMCMLSVIQDGVVILRQFLVSPPPFSSARLVFTAWTGGIGADIQVGDVVTTTAPNSPWKRLP